MKPSEITQLLIALQVWSELASVPADMAKDKVRRLRPIGQDEAIGH